MHRNRISLVGNVGNAPELRRVGDNSVATFSLATSERWTDKGTGEAKERTEWHRVVVWGKLADLVSQFVRVGDRLDVEGRMHYSRWQDKDGNDRYAADVVASDVIFPPKREGR